MVFILSIHVMVKEVSSYGEPGVGNFPRTAPLRPRTVQLLYRFTQTSRLGHVLVNYIQSNIIIGYDFGYDSRKGRIFMAGR